MNILMSTNSAYIIPTSVMLFSICENHRDEELNIYLAYRELQEELQDRLKEIVNQPGNAHSIHFISLNAEFYSSINFDSNYFSSDIYNRFLALEQLPLEVDRILYLDADMLVKGKLTEVYSFQLDDDTPFVVCEDIFGHKRDQWQFLFDHVNLKNTDIYFNTGFMLINMEYIRKNKSLGYILDAFKREGNSYLYPDQDILNIMYHNKVKFVPWSLYNITPEWWYLDCNELSKGSIKYLSYNEMAKINESDTKYVDVTLEMRDNARVIHFLYILKPWKYRGMIMWEDLALYAALWFDYEKLMYEKIAGLVYMT